MDDDERDEDDATKKYLEKARSCYVCNARYTEYDNLGAHVCRQHEGVIDAKRDVWLCCGASARAHRLPDDFYKGYVDELGGGCVPADHRDMANIYTSTWGHVVFPASYKELLAPTRASVRHPSRDIVLIRRYNATVSHAVHRAMTAILRTGKLPAQPLNENHPLVVKEMKAAADFRKRRRDADNAAAAARAARRRADARERAQRQQQEAQQAMVSDPPPTLAQHSARRPVPLQI